MSEGQVRVSGEVWAVVPKDRLTEEGAYEMTAQLRSAVPDKRWIVFGGPVDLVPLTGLDAAWREAEMAAPPEALIRAGRTGMTATGWATAYLHGEHIGTVFAPTLSAALLDLAAKLREPS